MVVTANLRVTGATYGVNFCFSFDLGCEIYCRMGSPVDDDPDKEIAGDIYCEQND